MNSFTYFVVIEYYAILYSLDINFAHLCTAFSISLKCRI
jgi:hypothetical protein